VPNTASGAKELFDASALLQAASAALAHAYAPYSHFAVGAAVQTSSGTIYPGCNVENASYGLAICAERVAIFSALASGDRSITRLALVTGGRELITPCGACRQVLMELAPTATVVMGTLAGDRRYTTVDELLPDAFRLGPGPG
jgi:cytidine deaminase